MLDDDLSIDKEVLKLMMEEFREYDIKSLSDYITPLVHSINDAVYSLDKSVIHFSFVSDIKKKHILERKNRRLYKSKK